MSIRWKRAVSCAVFVALAVGLPAAAMATPPAIGLDGRWHLQRTENLDEYLQKSGASWWRRQLAKLGTSRLRQTIRQEGVRFEIESENPVETRKDAFVADGKSTRTVETADGEEMTWVARIEGDALVLDGEGERGRRVVRRERVADALVMTIFNPEVDAECRMFFERADTD
jgi:hypothetical protein